MSSSLLVIMHTCNACGSELTFITRIRFLSRVSADMRTHTTSIVGEIAARITPEFMAERVLTNHKDATPAMNNQ